MTTSDRVSPSGSIYIELGHLPTRDIVVGSKVGAIVGVAGFTDASTGVATYPTVPIGTFYIVVEGRSNRNVSEARDAWSYWAVVNSIERRCQYLAVLPSCDMAVRTEIRAVLRITRLTQTTTRVPHDST